MVAITKVPRQAVNGAGNLLEEVPDAAQQRADEAEGALVRVHQNFCGTSAK